MFDYLDRFDEEIRGQGQGGMDLSKGAFLAWQAWCSGLHDYCDTVIVRTPVTDAKNFLLAFKNSGIDKFVLMDNSSLMESIHSLLLEGCVVVKTLELPKSDSADEIEIGILFAIPE